MRVQYSAVHERTTHFVWQCAHLKTVMELSAATQRRDIQSMACRHILYCRLVRGARCAAGLGMANRLVLWIASDKDKYNSIHDWFSFCTRAGRVSLKYTTNKKQACWTSWLLFDDLIRSSKGYLILTAVYRSRNIWLFGDSSPAVFMSWTYFLIINISKTFLWRF